MKAIYNFYMDCGRMGDVEGTFVADKEDVQKAMGKHIYFGEILGKHSEVSCNLNESHLTLITEDQEFISKFEEIMGEDWSSGHNIMDHLPDDDEDCDDE